MNEQLAIISYSYIIFKQLFLLIYQKEWDDDYLKWEPEDYDDVEQIVLAPTQLWIPDIGIQNRFVSLINNLIDIYLYQTYLIKNNIKYLLLPCIINKLCGRPVRTPTRCNNQTS